MQYVLSLFAKGKTVVKVWYNHGNVHDIAGLLLIENQ